MADIVDLRSRQPVNHADEFNAQLVQDLARFSEGGGLITEQEIRRRYKFDEATWNALGENEALFSAISDAKTQRVRSGALKRELAQKHIVRGPDILNGIASDSSASPRHRVDAIKTLDSLAVGGAEGAGAAAADRFIINIVLNSDDGSAPHVLHFDKSRTIDTNPNKTDDTPQDEWLPAIP